MNTKNRKLFYWVFAVFVLIVILFAYDMASRTTPPWERKKQRERLEKYKVDRFKKKEL